MHTSIRWRLVVLLVSIAAEPGLGAASRAIAQPPAGSEGISLASIGGQSTLRGFHVLTVLGDGRLAAVDRALGEVKLLSRDYQLLGRLPRRDSSGLAIAEPIAVAAIGRDGLLVLDQRYSHVVRYRLSAEGATLESRTALPARGTDLCVMRGRGYVYTPVAGGRVYVVNAVGALADSIDVPMSLTLPQLAAPMNDVRMACSREGRVLAIAPRLRNELVAMDVRTKRRLWRAALPGHRPVGFRLTDQEVVFSTPAEGYHELVAMHELRGGGLAVQWGLVTRDDVGGLETHVLSLRSGRRRSGNTASPRVVSADANRTFVLVGTRGAERIALSSSRQEAMR